MKLDQDLVREVLLAVEASEQDPRAFFKVEIGARNSEEISYHVMLLHEAGFIEATDTGSLSRFEWQPKRLTYSGHEFLVSIRDNEVWAKTKSLAKEAGGASISFLWEIAKLEIKRRIGIE